MHPVLVVRQPNRKALFIQIRESLDIGRECDGILIGDLQTSRRHAMIELRGSDLIIEDLGSTNGTFLDGERINVPVVLRPGCVVRLGDTTVELVEVAQPETTAAVGHRTTITADSLEVVDGVVRPVAGGPSGIRETSIDAVARAVHNAPQPDLAAFDYEGTVTIVFSDIESSTERATSMGDTAWMQVLSTHNEIVRRNVQKWGGRVVKNQGDGFMLTFPGVRRALQAMIAMQQELTEMEAQDAVGSVRVRVGVHTGEVIAEGGDIFGRHVMMAARVAGHAEGGEILVSALVREIASARGDLTFGEPRPVELKGIDGEHFVYPVLWR